MNGISIMLGDVYFLISNNWWFEYDDQGSRHRFSSSLIILLDNCY